MKSGSGRPPASRLPPVTELCDEHATCLRGLFRKRLHGLSDADLDDLVQDGLIEAHKSRASPLEPLALLAGIAGHLAADWIDRQRRQRAGREAVRAEQEREAPSPHERFELEQRYRALLEALEGLGPLFGEVFTRCVLDGEAVPLYAAALQISRNTGHSRLHKARQKWRECFERYLSARKLRREDL